MRRFLITVLIASQALLLAPSALAMGSGDKFLDAQVGLTYQIWKPTTTNKISIGSFRLLSCGAGNEQWLAAIYGKNKPQIQILENMASTPCSNPGLGVQVATISISGFKAKIVAFCDPANAKQWKNCSTSDIGRYGGFAQWNTKASKTLKATTIEVLTNGLTYAQLVTVAKGMKQV